MVRSYECASSDSKSPFLHCIVQNSCPLDEMVSAESIQAVVAKINDEDQGLAACLSAAKVHAAVQTALKDEGVENLTDLGSFFATSSYEAECEAFRVQIEAVKDRKIETARLRAAFSLARASWQEAKGSTTPASKAPAAVAVVDWEAPLESEEKASMLDAWKTRYGITLTMYQEPSDPLVNRLFREFRANTPTLIPVEKVRSVFQFQTPHAPRRTALASNVALTFDDQPDEAVRDVVQYHFALQVLGNANAKAGNYEVEENGHKVVYAPLDINSSYADHALRKASNRPGGQYNIVEWLREKDLHTRGLMVTYMRSGISQGASLKRALAETELMWTTGCAKDTWRLECSDVEEDSVAAKRPRRDRGSGSYSAGGSREPPAQQRRTEAKGKHQYATTASGGQKFCVAWNMGGCCKDERQCKKNCIHACNMLKPNGKPCWSRNHRALNHPQQTGNK